MEEVAGLVWDGNEEDYTGVSTCSPQRPPCISFFLLALPGLMCHTLGSPGSGLSLLLFLLGLCRKTLYPELLPPSADNSNSLSCQRALCSQLGPVFRASQHPLGLPFHPFLSASSPPLLLCCSNQLKPNAEFSSKPSVHSLRSHSGHLLSSQSTWIFRF